MVRRALALALIVLPASQLIRAQQPVAVSGAPQVPAGAINLPDYVLVLLKDGTGVKGYLVAVTDDALHVQAADRAGIVRTLPVTRSSSSTTPPISA